MNVNEQNAFLDEILKPISNLSISTGGKSYAHKKLYYNYIRIADISINGGEIWMYIHHEASTTKSTVGADFHSFGLNMVELGEPNSLESIKHKLEERIRYAMAFNR